MRAALPGNCLYVDVDYTLVQSAAYVQPSHACTALSSPLHVSNELGSVRPGLRQPAMSHALNRLRHMLKDELFIRTPQGMVPTQRAETGAAAA
jgi:hypothetical protein